MIIGIGSENKSKVAACKCTIESLYSGLNLISPVKYIARHTDSGIDPMPWTIEEMMTGARNRAQNLYIELKKKEESIRFTIGMEGGIFKRSVSNTTAYFLQSWVYVFDGIKGAWGSSGAVPLPGYIPERMIAEKKELAGIIDAITGQDDVRSGDGAVGILTSGRLKRQRFFETALEVAFAPFYNSPFYTDK